MLTASKILDEKANGKLDIVPFDKKHLNPNSYNVHIRNTLKVYDHPTRILDTRKDNPPDRTITISEDGFVLQPGVLYLGATEEVISSDYYVPNIDGRSSIGRLGIQVHMTAGFGDIGFKGTFTFEITVVKPVKIYPGDEIAQVYFDTPDGDIDFLYNGRYKGQIDPTESRGQINSETIEGYHYEEEN